MTRNDVTAEQTVFIVDDDDAVCDALYMLMTASGLKVETFSSANSFLKEYNGNRSGCLVLDIRMPGLSGLELQDELHKRRIQLPIIFLTGHGDVPLAVRTLKKGAHDFIEKPHEEQRLILSVLNALKSDAYRRKKSPQDSGVSDGAAGRLKLLSIREREVLDCVLDGKPTREIAERLCISIKTVEFHRARLREKLGVSSLAELFKLFNQRAVE